jgi:hypothetical protein
MYMSSFVRLSKRGQPGFWFLLFHIILFCYHACIIISSLNIFFLLALAFSVHKLLISGIHHPFCTKLITFSSYGICFGWLFVMYRHHIYEKHGGPKSVELKEIGPRFEMRLYQVSLMPIRSLFPAHKSPCHQVRKGFHNVIDISNWQTYFI